MRGGQHVTKEFEIGFTLLAGRHTVNDKDDYVWINPATGEGFTDIKHSFVSACFDAKVVGLVWHDLRATYGTRLGEAGFTAYDIAKLMGHANLSTSQRCVRNLPVGSGEAVLLKNQRRHNTVTSEQSGTLALVVTSCC